MQEGVGNDCHGMNSPLASGHSAKVLRDDQARTSAGRSRDADEHQVLGDGRDAAACEDWRRRAELAGACAGWCPRPDSNWHALRRRILSPLRLPISSRGQGTAVAPRSGGLSHARFCTRRTTDCAALRQFERAPGRRHACESTLNARRHRPRLQDPRRRDRRHAAGAAAAPARRRRRPTAATSILGKLEGNNPAGFGQGPAGDRHDPRAPKSAARSSPATR